MPVEKEFWTCITMGKRKIYWYLPQTLEKPTLLQDIHWHFNTTGNTEELAKPPDTKILHTNHRKDFLTITNYKEDYITVVINQNPETTKYITLKKPSNGETTQHHLQTFYFHYIWEGNSCISRGLPQKWGIKVNLAADRYKEMHIKCCKG